MGGLILLNLRVYSFKMDASQLKQHYDNLLKDEDFDKLDLGLKNPNT